MFQFSKSTNASADSTEACVSSDSVTLSNSSVSSVVYKMSYFVVFARPCYTEAKCIESMC